MQCVAQTCLEKGRAEEQVSGEEEEGNETDGRYSICFTPRQITGEATRLTNVVPSAEAGLPMLQSGTCMLVWSCNVRPGQDSYRGSTADYESIGVLLSGNTDRLLS